MSQSLTTPETTMPETMALEDTAVVVIPVREISTPGIPTADTTTVTPNLEAPISGTTPSHTFASGTPEAPVTAVPVGNTPALQARPELHKVKQAIFIPNQGEMNLHKEIDSTITDLLDLLSLEQSQSEDDILRIFFLPPIHADKRPDDDFGVISEHPTLCVALTEALHIDPTFLGPAAWDSNGFFMSQTHGGPDSASIRSDISRFLIKFLKRTGNSTRDAKDNRPEYGWLYLSFCAVWLKRHNADQGFCILVCFDDWDEIKNDILRAFKGYPSWLLTQDLLSVHDALLRRIVWHYDRALWLFRTPIRKIEKDREHFAHELGTNEPLSTANPEGVMGRYDNMHEYSRHVIHSSETLQAASAVVNKMIDHFSLRESYIQDGVSGSNILNGLRFSSQFLTNLKLRADAFRDRLENEIQLAYNVVSVHQLQDTKRLLEQTQRLLEQTQGILAQTRDEGKDMTTTVTWLSLLFLPASFAASFWGMNFISVKEGTPNIEVANMKISTGLWLFFALALGLLLISVLIWASIHYLGWAPSLRLGNVTRRRARNRTESMAIQAKTAGASVVTLTE